MKPVTNTPEQANIISIETLKKASAPPVATSSSISDIFTGIEGIVNNPVMQPFIAAGTQLIQAYATTMIQKAQKPQNTYENDGKVLFE